MTLALDYLPGLNDGSQIPDGIKIKLTDAAGKLHNGTSKDSKAEFEQVNISDTLILEVEDYLIVTNDELGRPKGLTSGRLIGPHLYHEKLTIPRRFVATSINVFIEDFLGYMTLSWKQQVEDIIQEQLQ